MDAAEFVPGQWGKPTQAAIIPEVTSTESQHSVSGLTDDDSAVQGSDANQNGWTAAEYSQQYYTAQVPCAISHLSLSSEAILEVLCLAS